MQEEKEEDKPVVDQEDLELDEIDKHIAELKEEEAREQKRKKRLAEKARVKLQEKMDLKMVLEGDKGPMLEEESMFRLSTIKSGKELKKIEEQTPELLAESEPESDDEKPKPKKVRFVEGENNLDSSGK